MKLFKKRQQKPLRACAFCGGEPILIKCGNHKEFVVYQCSRCYETPVGFDEARVCEQAARRIWNDRTEEAERTLNIYKRIMASTTIFTCREP